MPESFKDISFIIHARIDIPERVANLETVMDYYHDTCTDCEFIIVNDDIEPDSTLKPLYNKYKHTSKFLFFKNDDIYMRTLSFNKGFKESTRPLVIAGDTDVIIHPKHIKKAADIILSGEASHVYPYNGLFVHIKEHIRDFFKEKFTNSILRNEKNNVFEPRSPQSCQFS